MNYFLLACLASLPPFLLQAAYTVKNGKLMSSEIVATVSVQEHYSTVIEAYQQQDWATLMHQSLVIINNFPETPFAEESLFYLGVADYYLGELELANNNLTDYLKKSAPKFFEEALDFKFKIAEQYHHGAKKHLLGWESLPKWVPARDEAVKIYDEVITALPNHELAAQALFGKAQLLSKNDEYQLSIEAFQTLIRRFPKHPLSIESYIGVSNAYLTQSKERYPDQDFLDLAEINLKKFKTNFPGEERVAEVEKSLAQMKEVFAGHLYDTGKFYERTKKIQAALIYYNRILAKYPDTEVAKSATRRMDNLKTKHLSSS